MSTFLKAATAALFCLNFSSCIKTKKLTEAEISFNPYNKGDTLIFQLNDNLIDTVFVDDVIIQTVASNPMMDKEKEKWQDLIVQVRHVAGGKDTLPGRTSGSILIINNKQKTFVNFWFTGYKQREASSKEFYMKDIDTTQPIRYKTKAGEFDDVIVLWSDIQYVSHIELLYEVYWSRKYGLVAIKYDPKHYWELIKRLPAKK